MPDAMTNAYRRKQQIESIRLKIARIDAHLNKIQDGRHTILSDHGLELLRQSKQQLIEEMQCIAAGVPYADKADQRTNDPVNPDRPDNRSGDSTKAANPEAAPDSRRDQRQ